MFTIWDERIHKLVHISDLILYALTCFEVQGHYDLFVNPWHSFIKHYMSIRILVKYGENEGGFFYVKGNPKAMPHLHIMRH